MHKPWTVTSLLSPSSGTRGNNHTAEYECLSNPEFIHDVHWKCLGINLLPRNLLLWPMSSFISLEYSFRAGGAHRERGRGEEIKGRREKRRERIFPGGGISYQTKSTVRLQVDAIGSFSLRHILTQILYIPLREQEQRRGCFYFDCHRKQDNSLFWLLLNHSH